MSEIGKVVCMQVADDDSPCEAIKLFLYACYAKYKAAFAELGGGA